STISIPASVLSDANFNGSTIASVLAHMQVTVNITYNHLDRIGIRLVAPDGTKVDLLLPHVDGFNVAIPGQGIPTANAGFNLGTYSFAGLGGPHTEVGTIFDDESALQINDPGAKAPFIGTYRPETDPVNNTNLLSVFNGSWFGGGVHDLSGTW